MGALGQVRCQRSKVSRGIGNGADCSSALNVFIVRPANRQQSIQIQNAFIAVQNSRWLDKWVLCSSALGRLYKGFSRRGFGVFRAKGARELSPSRRMERSGTLGIRINISAALKERKKRDPTWATSAFWRSDGSKSCSRRHTTVSALEDRRAATRVARGR